LDSKRTPLIKTRLIARKPMGLEDLINHPYGGDEVPTTLSSKGVRRNYDDLHETTLSGASTLY
jgi:hypothetical protein